MSNTMFQKITLAVAGFIVAGTVLAQHPVDINKADQAALDGIKGVGPAMSQAILDERKKGGLFRDWPDLERRVKGIKAKSARRLSDAGLTIDDQPRKERSPGSGKGTVAARDRTGESVERSGAGTKK